MTITRGAWGRTLAVALALPLTGAALVVAAPGAAADVRQPVDGSTFTSYRTVTIQADYGRSNVTERLFLTSPGGAEVEIDAQPSNFSDGTLEYVLDLACWTKGCSGSQLAPNGTWTVRQGGGTSATSTFTTAIEPAAPTALRAEPLNPREVQISWRLGAEPDLVAWTVYEGSAPVQERVGRSACAGSTCSTVVRYASPGSGDHSYTVKAHRSTAPGSTSTLDSPMSAPASVRLENPPPSPAPTPGDTGSGGGSGGAPANGNGSTGGAGAPGSGGSADDDTPTTGGDTTGGDPAAPAPIGTGSPAAGESADAKAVAQRKAFALGFSAFGPKLGIPKLPPLPQAQAPAIAPELADGTFEPTLGFEDQVVTERVEVAQGPTQRVRNVVGTALDSERLATSTAAALVLLLAGAHLRRWLGTASEEH